MSNPPLSPQPAPGSLALSALATLAGGLGGAPGDAAAASPVEQLGCVLGADAVTLYVADDPPGPALSAGFPPDFPFHLAAESAVVKGLADASRDGPVAVASLEPAALPVSVTAGIRAGGITHLLVREWAGPEPDAGFVCLGWHGPVAAPPDEAAVFIGWRLVSARLTTERLRQRANAAVAAERRLADEEAALHSLTLLADTTPAFAELATTTIRLVVAMLGAAAGSYASLDGDQLRHEAWTGVKDWFIDRVRGIPAATMTPVRRLSHGEAPYVQPNVEGAVQPQNLVASRELGFTSYAAVPVRIGDRLEALMMFWFRRPVDVVETERDLEAISRIAGISLANFRLRERLQASELRYRVLFEESPEAIILVTTGGDVLDANPAALRLYRTDLDGLRAHLAPGSPGAAAAHLFRLAELARQGGRSAAPETGIRPDGTAFPQEVAVVPVRIDGAERFFLLIRDLTTARQLQQELLQAQKMEALGQLVSGVAHELNNPLAAIVAFSQLIAADDRLPHDMRHDAGLLVQEADRTRRIVQNLLDFARQRPPERHPTSVHALVESVVALQAYGLAANQIELSVDIPPDLPLVEIDRSQIQQVLLNLTLNAIHALRTTAGPRNIRISARAVGGGEAHHRVRVSVGDNGPGIPEDQRSRIFLPFYTTKAPGEGTGLGLSVSFGIAASHGGSLKFEPRAGGGAVFVMDLPVAPGGASASVHPADPAEAAPAPALVPGPTAAQAAGAHPPAKAGATDLGAVLIVDDEPGIRVVLTRALRGAGFRPVAVASGAAAIALCRDRTFDVVMVDHRMAGMSGTEVFDALLAIRPELASRFVFMSGDVLNAELRAYASRHGVTLIAKPFDVRTVIRVATELAARHSDRS